MSGWWVRPNGEGAASDASLSALLVVQLFTQFVAIPLAANHPAGHTLFDIGNLVFAALCAVTLTTRRALQTALIAGLLAVVATPRLLVGVGVRLGVGPEATHISIALLAFAFNVLVTALVAKRIFGPGQVTVHRVQGAVLMYLNVAALFAIAYNLLELHSAGAIKSSTGGDIALAPGARLDELWYFSLSTITTTGFGDFVPIRPLARSLANLEAVFGQIFPATLLARLVSLHLVHSEGSK
ncbi:MAG: hypothetical protein JWN53_2043 [Gemmatimonadetes bacterium]|nr:hypothetical protein [Gemmatimonadota bacterium]